MPRGKLYSSCAEAVADIGADSKVLVGGFGECGTPSGLLEALGESESARRLTVVAGTGGGGPDSALGRLVAAGRVAELVTTYVGTNASLYRRHAAGRLRLRLLPQGAFAESLRAGGSGVPAFYARAGADLHDDGADVEVDDGTTPRETREFDGVRYVLRRAIRGNFALLKAWKADTLGNLVMRRSANNFNSLVAAAADVAVAEVDEIVEAGRLDPDCVHVPGVFVHRLVLRQFRPPPPPPPPTLPTPSERKLSDPAVLRIVRRAALELPPGCVANLGLGIPTLVANCLPPGGGVLLHSENGVLGVGPAPSASPDADVVNASSDPVTLAPGAVCLHSADSFGLVNSGRLDVTILGATQVSESGDMANWIVPGRAAVGMGGAMDLVGQPDRTRVVVAMRHRDAAGRSKLLRRCTLPLTGRRCVSVVVTELAVFVVDRHRGGLTLTELADGVSVAEVADCTSCGFDVSPRLRPMRQAQTPL